jgi:hypothetical protein
LSSKDKTQTTTRTLTTKRTQTTQRTQTTKRTLTTKKAQTTKRTLAVKRAQTTKRTQTTKIKWRKIVNLLVAQGKALDGAQRSSLQVRRRRLLEEIANTVTDEERMSTHTFTAVAAIRNNLKTVS